MRSILSSQELTRMLALVESPGDLVTQMLPQRNAARRSRSARFGGPIGFAATRVVGGRKRYGTDAAPGAWSADGARLVLDILTLGNDDAMRVTFVFADKTVALRFEAANGFFKAKVQGRIVESGMNEVLEQVSFRHEC